MPSWSGAGNISPVSTTTIRPSYSTTVMFLPISPSPPSGRTRRESVTPDCLQQPVALEHRADHVQLLLVELDVGQTRCRVRQDPEQAERGLGRAGQRRHRHVPVDILEPGVDLAPTHVLVGHVGHLYAALVACHKDI